jgi:hypothetical protein
MRARLGRAAAAAAAALLVAGAAGRAQAGLIVSNLGQAQGIQGFSEFLAQSFTVGGVRIPSAGVERSPQASPCPAAAAPVPDAVGRLVGGVSADAGTPTAEDFWLLMVTSRGSCLPHLSCRS